MLKTDLKTVPIFQNAVCIDAMTHSMCMCSKFTELPLLNFKTVPFQKHNASIHNYLETVLKSNTRYNLRIVPKSTKSIPKQRFTQKNGYWYTYFFTTDLDEFTTDLDYCFG